MNKRFIYSLAATFITAAVTLGSLTACSSEDIMVVEKQTATQAPTYTVCIPASMGEDAETRAVTFNGTNKAVSTFAAGDKVYIYNETKGAMACDGEGNAIALTLTSGDISNDGKNCTLAGTLTFYKYENSTWNAVAVESSDSYKLLYKFLVHRTGRHGSGYRRLCHSHDDTYRRWRSADTIRHGIVHKRTIDVPIPVH